MMRRSKNSRRVALAAGIVLASAAAAGAQLRQDQVLVVYDNRIPDSLAVAEFYAGSAKVPGGTGGQPGARPGVRVLNIASLPGGGVSPFTPTITHAQYRSAFRDPIRSHLNTTGLNRIVRCIVLTKGIPHRLDDTDLATAGDFPGVAAGEFNAGDATYASLDSELTLLQQNTNLNENGNTGDSRMDGVILNPFHRSTLPIAAFTTANITLGKSFANQVSPNGLIYQSTIATQSARFTPGDMYLVCRLDGPTVQVVRDIITRAQNPVYDVNAAAFILDESGGNGLPSADFAADGEIDNDSIPIAAIYQGDDYELARDRLLADGRFNPGRVFYDFLAGASNFTVGPLAPFGGTRIVSDPVALLTHYGANHNGAPGGNAFFEYATGFNYASGAVFNTAESYNGRDYGGLGQGSVTQQQSSQFLASGGTFAIGNVYEPFSFTLADSEFIVQNFFLGTMSWAEAAYSALPAISWQQVVVGDPLARAVRSIEDRSGDAAVTTEDLYVFTGAPADLNRSGGVTAQDRALLEGSIRGHESAMMIDNRR